MLSGIAGKYLTLSHWEFYYLHNEWHTVDKAGIYCGLTLVCSGSSMTNPRGGITKKVKQNDSLKIIPPLKSSEITHAQTGALLCACFEYHLLSVTLYTAVCWHLLYLVSSGILQLRCITVSCSVIIYVIMSFRCSEQTYIKIYSDRNENLV